MILIYTIFPDKKSAEKAIKIILKNRLATCVNYWPIEAQYLWRSSDASTSSAKSADSADKKTSDDKSVRLKKAREWALIIKTISKNYQKIEKLIKKNNPYEIPAILSWSATKVEKKYLRWLEKEIK